MDSYKKLKVSLEQQGFAVIYCATDTYVQIDDVGLTEIWLVILVLILQKIEENEDSLSFAYLPNAIADLEQWLRISPPKERVSYGLRGGKILEILQKNRLQRQHLHHHLETRLKNSLLAIGEEVTAMGVDRLKHLGRKGLVILMDNLDRLALEQVKLIFGEGGKYLRQLQCHLIYTLPIIAITPVKEQFLQRLKANSPILLPNLTLRDRKSIINSDCLQLLRQIILARLLPNLSPTQRLERVTDVFENLETLDLLCLASQGHLSYLLLLLYGCLQWQDPPIKRYRLQQILEIDRTNRLATVGDRDRQSLQKAISSPYELTLETINLCRRLLLFDYRDVHGHWFTSPFADSN